MAKHEEPQFTIRAGMIDSHFHSRLMREKGLDPEALLAEGEELGFAGGLDIGISAGDIAERQHLRRRFPRIRLAAGLYPAEATADDLEQKLQQLAADLSRYPVSAVGETGVDLHWDYGGAAPQMELMRRQIDLANRFSLPVIVHNRKADEEVLEVLRSTPPAQGGVMHCFSSGPKTARAALELGMSVSFAGNLSYKKSEEIRAAAREVPDGRLLAETDSPFLSPQRMRGQPNHPGHVGLVYEELASVRQRSIEELIGVIGRNFEELFPQL